MAMLAKDRVEYSLKTALRSLNGVVARAERLRREQHASKIEAGLLEDTLYNIRERYPRAHRLMAANPLVPPARLSTRAYLEILHVDLEDPYLGLAPNVLGGEPGRKAPEKPVQRRATRAGA